MISIKKNIAEFVAEDYRAAAVFESFGIDFYCKDRRTVEEVCEKKCLNPIKVFEALKKVSKTEHCSDKNLEKWPIDLLADFIEKKHHRYVEERIPILLKYLVKLCKVHGDHHPELLDVYRNFCESASDLTAHLLREELVLFPYIRKMVQLGKEGRSLDDANFRAVKTPVLMMMEEHEAEGEKFEKIAKLTSGYRVPAGTCNTYKTTYLLLAEFEENLQRHIHLENDMLFPKALAFEKALKCY